MCYGRASGGAHTAGAVSKLYPPAHDQVAGFGGLGGSKSGSVRQAKKLAGRKINTEGVRSMDPLGAPPTPCQTVMALASPLALPIGDVLSQEASKAAPIM